MIQGVKSPRPGIVAIDLHRGHLDPAVATMPLDASAVARVVAANERFLNKVRAAGLPVFHCVATYRDAYEIRLNPAWRHRGEDPDKSAQACAVARHQGHAWLQGVARFCLMLDNTNRP